jgi:PAS domain S-box-containing protein
MNPLKRSLLNSTVFALGLTALALISCQLLQRRLEPNVSLPFIAVVWLSAWYHGLSGGLIATCASAVSVLYLLFLPARADVAPPTPGGLLIRLTTFIVVALIITFMTAAWSENRLLLFNTLSSLGEAILVIDRRARIRFLNPLAETLTGWPMARVRGKPVGEVMRMIGAKDRQPLENPLFQALQEQVLVSPAEHALLISRNGAEVLIEHTAAPLRDEAGSPRGAILVFRDIGTRRQLEEQITQAQTMDAVSRLAGEISGDFNNVLTVIAGYADLLRGGIPPGSPLRRFVDEIVLASERAATLTRHLLAFSRGAASQPRPLDLGFVAKDMEAMLRRMLGPGIELMLLTSPELGQIMADPSQIEQVIVNLANNAHDAMQKGGKLVIETSNVDLDDSASSQNLGLRPGPYVMMAFSDNGIGMDAETRSRIFEPFFTTKGAGKGSGLGLATVYGSIRQAGGQITVFSQPGYGTIFEIYLPRVTKVSAEKPKVEHKGSETILLVDDEEGVRSVLGEILRTNGYEVLEADNGAAALAAWEKNAHKVDLVIADIVMPKMSGFELGRQVNARAPGSKMIYMSGYRDHPVEGAPPDWSKAFLQKPFARDTLLAKVREILDQ